jgi:hypothetical protein
VWTQKACRAAAAARRARVVQPERPAGVSVGEQPMSALDGALVALRRVTDQRSAVCLAEVDRYRCVNEARPDGAQGHHPVHVPARVGHRSSPGSYSLANPWVTHLVCWLSRRNATRGGQLTRVLWQRMVSRPPGRRPRAGGAAAWRQRVRGATVLAAVPLELRLTALNPRRCATHRSAKRPRTKVCPSCRPRASAPGPTLAARPSDTLTHRRRLNTRRRQAQWTQVRVQSL